MCSRDLQILCAYLFIGRYSLLASVYPNLRCLQIPCYDNWSLKLGIGGKKIGYSDNKLHRPVTGTGSIAWQASILPLNHRFWQVIVGTYSIIIYLPLRAHFPLRARFCMRLPFSLRAHFSLLFYFVLAKRLEFAPVCKLFALICFPVDIVY